MRPLAADEIRGTWGTLLLPINSVESMDFSRLSDQLEAALDAGVDGMYCNGTAGEFETLDDAEFEQIALLLADRCQQRNIPFQIGACATGSRDALRRISQSKRFHPGAIQVILPDWRPVSDAEAVG